MIATDKFYQSLNTRGIRFFAGVPDSLLKDICAYITENTSKKQSIITANEGGAIALATGFHLASGNIPLVYMQNSGLGNAINPLLSLADQEVYSIPILLMIGWRGEPGIKDEPQHVKQGEVLLNMLDAMRIPYAILPDDIDNANFVLNNALDYMNKNQSPFALLIRKGIFETYKLKSNKSNEYILSRETAINEIIKSIGENDIVVSTTGMASRELYELREKLGKTHKNDFLTVGCMGHANQIALGIALEKPKRNVFCFDGDGAILMHTGSLSIIGDLAPKNYKHIILNNGAHDSVGGQPTVGFKTDFCKIAEACNYQRTFKVKSLDKLKISLEELKNTDGPSLLEILINKGARKDLGRPAKSPIENKLSLMESLKI